VLNSLLGCLKQRVVVIGGSFLSLMGRVILLRQQAQFAMLLVTSVVLLSAPLASAQTDSNGPTSPPAAQQAGDAATLAAPTAAPTVAGELLPGGTTVSVSLEEPLNSSTASVDDQIAIVVRKP